MIGDRRLEEMREWLEGRADEFGDTFLPVVDDMALMLLSEVDELRKAIKHAVHKDNESDWPIEEDLKALKGISSAYRDVWGWWVQGSRRIDELVKDQERVWDAGFAEGVIDQSRYEATGEPEVGEKSRNPYRGQGVTLRLVEDDSDDDDGDGKWSL